MFEQGKIDDFQPSSDTISKMLKVRTRPLIGLAIHHPGIFNIHKYPTDMGLFVLVLALEAYGLTMIYYVTSVLNDAPPIMPIVGAILAFLADLTAAKFHHKFAVAKNKVLLLENATLEGINEQSKIARIHDNERIISKNMHISRMAAIFIIFLAIGKSYLFHIFFPPSADGEANNSIVWTMLLIAVYCGAAYIHIYHTGYALGGFWADRAWNAELKQHISDIGNATGGTKGAEKQNLETGENLKELVEYKTNSALHEIGFHKIEMHEEDPKFKLIRRGLLRDHEIEQMDRLARSDEAKRDIERAAMILQFKLIHRGV